MKRSRKKLIKKRKKRKTTKDYLKTARKSNELKRRNFVNLECTRCGREYHIRVNDKEEFLKAIIKNYGNIKNYICIVCR